ncbi:MAG: indole-3-glycerol-phosphate synthase [Nitrososphaerota archaeon]|nr:indole-3-glycerol-phosphate synthase [Nitrososphaerota archaeon]
MQRADGRFLQTLAQAAKARVREGYYAPGNRAKTRRASLVAALGMKRRIPVIAEVKFRSPSAGAIARRGDVARIARAYERGGAAAISVLTEPENFGGSLMSLSLVAKTVSVPVLMKDIIVDRAQVEAGALAGADAVLLISGIFSSGLGTCLMDEMVDFAHRKGLEVVAEAHDEEEFDAAFRSKADIVGINNRDLRTLSVSLETSRRLLSRGPRPRPVICESGIGRREEIEELKALGADGFLVGSALMKAVDPEATLRELSRVGPR